MKFLFLNSHAHFALDPAATRVSGGAELQVALLARELARLGHDALIVGGDTGQRDGVVLDGVRTRVGGKFQTGGLADTLRALPRVLRIVRGERPDFVGILGWTTWLWFLHLFKKWNRYQLVFICGLDTEVNGGFRRENPVRGALFESAMRKSDARFAMTEHQRDLFQRTGMECGLYRNLILPRRHPRTVAKDVDFLWVARCRTFKHPQMFLDLAERLPSARFAMICPNEDAALWNAVESRAGKMLNVEFHERVPYHAIQDFYDRARVFVNTSEYEGFANSFIQAGQGGAAILSFEVDSDGVLSRHGAGICAQRDETRFFAVAGELMNERDKLATMQRASSRFVDDVLDNNKNVEAFLKGLPPPR